VNPFIHQVISNPFTWGLVLGLIFTGIVWYRVIVLKGELKRYKRHLSDKLEIEAESGQRVKGDVERLRKENENLRVKVSSLNEFPERRLERDLEIYARAEKRMVVSVPGFAGPWETAKQDAVAEIQGEENGQSLPKRVFARLFTGSREEKAALPDGSASQS
jgi:hypothetical protein